MEKVIKLKKNIKKGFTLVELLVVIAILAILASVSVVGYLGFTQKANQSNCDTELAQVENVLLSLETGDEIVYNNDDNKTVKYTVSMTEIKSNLYTITVYVGAKSSNTTTSSTELNAILKEVFADDLGKLSGIFTNDGTNSSDTSNTNYLKYAAYGKTSTSSKIKVVYTKSDNANA